MSTADAHAFASVRGTLLTSPLCLGHLLPGNTADLTLANQERYFSKKSAILSKVCYPCNVMSECPMLINISVLGRRRPRRTPPRGPGPITKLHHEFESTLVFNPLRDLHLGSLRSGRRKPRRLMLRAPNPHKVLRVKHGGSYCLRCVQQVEMLGSTTRRASSSNRLLESSTT